MTVNLTCSGPGPHVPASGVLGKADKPLDVRCSAPACRVGDDPALAAAVAARAANREAVKAIVADLKAEKARVEPIIAKSNNQVTAGDTKDIARAAKRIADAAIDLARFVRDLA